MHTKITIVFLTNVLLFASFDAVKAQNKTVAPAVNNSKPAASAAKLATPTKVVAPVPPVAAKATVPAATPAVKTTAPAPVAPVPAPVAPKPKPAVVQKSDHLTLRFLKSKFSESSILREIDRGKVANTKWGCWSTPAFFKEDTERFYDLWIDDVNGILRVRTNLNPETSVPRAASFTDRGLATVIPPLGGGNQVEPYHYINVMRISRSGNLLIENVGFGIKAWNESTNPRSVSFPDRYAGAYVVCTHGTASQVIAPGIPGRCSVNSEEYNTEEGGCLHFDTGTVFSMSPPWSQLTYGEAETYCSNLVEGGRSDWSLPREGELKKAAAGAHDHFSFGVYKPYWAKPIGRSPNAPIVDLGAGNSKLTDKGARKGGVVCVFHPLDQDRDHIPDSSDECKSTPEGSFPLVQRTGPYKGCIAAEIGRINGVGEGAPEGQQGLSSGEAALPGAAEAKLYGPPAVKGHPVELPQILLPLNDDLNPMPDALPN